MLVSANQQSYVLLDDRTYVCTISEKIVNKLIKMELITFFNDSLGYAELLEHDDYISLDMISGIVMHIPS